MNAPAIDRLMARVVIDVERGGCWIPTGALQSKGYAVISDEGEKVYCHRLAYEHFVGPIPDGLQIDHTCRVRACCNPEHLEAVTPRENNLRSLSPTWIAYRTDTCGRGHSLLDAYEYGYGRICRTCQSQRSARYRALRAAA